MRHRSAIVLQLGTLAGLAEEASRARWWPGVGGKQHRRCLLAAVLDQSQGLFAALERSLNCGGSFRNGMGAVGEHKVGDLAAAPRNVDRFRRASRAEPAGAAWPGLPSKCARNVTPLAGAVKARTPMLRSFAASIGASISTCSWNDCARASWSTIPTCRRFDYPRGCSRFRLVPEIYPGALTENEGCRGRGNDANRHGIPQ